MRERVDETTERGEAHLATSVGARDLHGTNTTGTTNRCEGLVVHVPAMWVATARVSIVLMDCLRRTESAGRKFAFTWNTPR